MIVRHGEVRRGSKTKTKTGNRRHAWSRNIFGESRQTRKARGLSLLRKTDTAPEMVLRVARVAIAREYARGSVYKPTWRAALKNLVRRPSAGASALAAWWLACGEQLGPRLARDICRAVTEVFWCMADFRDGPLMANGRRGRQTTIAKEGFRWLFGRRPRDFRKSLWAQADALEELAKVCSNAKRLAQIASGGKDVFTQLVEYAEALRKEANKYLEIVPHLRAEAMWRPLRSQPVDCQCASSEDVHVTISHHRQSEFRSVAGGVRRQRGARV
jgi:hypothetical protein